MATLKKTKNGIKTDYRLMQVKSIAECSLIAGQKYSRMLKREHSAILSTFIKLPVVIKPLFCLFLSGRFTQVLLFICK